MMGQALFEDPQRQYAEYGLTVLDLPLPTRPLDNQSDDPNGDVELSTEFADASDEQLNALDELLDSNPDFVLTFDQDYGTWIAGPESNVDDMFDARQQFVDALEAGEDPGV